ncbi:aldo-keto reductase family 1 member B1-like isoform X2 [Eurosta solidaginis]|uniref:aldo-keto reductase family 1 member B1-like isoform X2 n=1 Tax=Eurosta solidaginis TaxID=178769 RepID=UPI003531391C
MSAIANIDKLCGDNFYSWSVQMKGLLITQDLWDVVELSCSAEATVAEKEQWHKLDRKALATITLCVRSSELIYIRNCKIAKEAWQNLEKTYKDKGPGRKMPVNHVTRLVKEAVKVGYRHIDCADSYGNQTEVGVGLEEIFKEGVVKRKYLFITGKLWNTKHDPKLVRGACENALKELRITYFDNYLIHWPTGFADSEEMYPKDADGRTRFTDVDYIDTWCALEGLVELGLCRSIGLSNFNIQQIKRVLDVARIKPANLQVECHPYLNQSKLMDFCREHNIVVTAYSPLGSPHSPYDKPGAYKLLEHPIIIELSKKYQKGPALVLLQYQLQRGNVVITMSTRTEHMTDNLNVCSFELSEADMEEIDKLDINGRFNLMKRLH